MKYKGPVNVSIEGAREDPRAPFLVAMGRRMLGLIESTQGKNPKASAVSNSWGNETDGYVRVLWTPRAKVCAVVVPTSTSYKETSVEKEDKEKEYEYFKYVCFNGVILDVGWPEFVGGIVDNEYPNIGKELQSGNRPSNVVLSNKGHEIVENVLLHSGPFSYKKWKAPIGFFACTGETPNGDSLFVGMKRLMCKKEYEKAVFCLKGAEDSEGSVAVEVGIGEDAVDSPADSGLTVIPGEYLAPKANILAVDYDSDTAYIPVTKQVRNAEGEREPEVSYVPVYCGKQTCVVPAVRNNPPQDNTNFFIHGIPIILDNGDGKVLIGVYTTHQFVYNDRPNSFGTLSRGRTWGLYEVPLSMFTVLAGVLELDLLSMSASATAFFWSARYTMRPGPNGLGTLDEGMLAGSFLEPVKNLISHVAGESPSNDVLAYDFSFSTSSTTTSQTGMSKYGAVDTFVLDPAYNLNHFHWRKGNVATAGPRLGCFQNRDLVDFQLRGAVYKAHVDYLAEWSLVRESPTASSGVGGVTWTNGGDGAKCDIFGVGDASSYSTNPVYYDERNGSVVIQVGSTTMSIPYSFYSESRTGLAKGWQVIWVTPAYIPGCVYNPAIGVGTESVKYETGAVYIATAQLTIGDKTADITNVFNGTPPAGYEYSYGSRSLPIRADCERRRSSLWVRTTLDSSCLVVEIMDTSVTFSGNTVDDKPNNNFTKFVGNENAKARPDMEIGFSRVYVLTPEGDLHTLQANMGVCFPGDEGLPIGFKYNPISKEFYYVFKGDVDSCFFFFAGADTVLQKLPPGGRGPIRKEKTDNV